MTRLTRVLRAADLHSTRTARPPRYTLLPARIAAAPHRTATLHSAPSPHRRRTAPPRCTLLPARIAARAATVVCVLVMTVSPAKADEPIALSFRAD